MLACQTSPIRPQIKAVQVAVLMCEVLCFVTSVAQGSLPLNGSGAEGKRTEKMRVYVYCSLLIQEGLQGNKPLGFTAELQPYSLLSLGISEKMHQRT